MRINAMLIWYGETDIGEIYFKDLEISLTSIFNLFVAAKHALNRRNWRLVQPRWPCLDEVRCA